MTTETIVLNSSFVSSNPAMMRQAKANISLALAQLKKNNHGCEEQNVVYHLDPTEPMFLHFLQAIYDRGFSNKVVLITPTLTYCCFPKSM